MKNINGHTQGQTNYLAKKHNLPNESKYWCSEHRLNPKLVEGYLKWLVHGAFGPNFEVEPSTPEVPIQPSMTRHSGNTCQQRAVQTRLRTSGRRKQALKGSKGQNTVRVTHAKRTARAESPTAFAKRSASAQASSDSSVRDDAAMTEDGSPPFEVATGMRRQVSDTRWQLRSSRRIDLKSSGRPDENSEYETSSEVEHSAGPRCNAPGLRKLPRNQWELRPQLLPEPRPDR